MFWKFSAPWGRQTNLHSQASNIDEQWDVPALEKALEGEFGVHVPVNQWLAEDDQVHEEVLRQRIIEAVDTHFLAKEEQTGAPVMRHFEKALMLNVLDQH